RPAAVIEDVGDDEVEAFGRRGPRLLGHRLPHLRGAGVVADGAADGVTALQEFDDCPFADEPGRPRDQYQPLRIHFVPPCSPAPMVTSPAAASNKKGGRRGRLPEPDTVGR